jgi:hypothetical protein
VQGYTEISFARIPAPGLPFGEKFRKRWRPMPKGCCSCQYRRHVIIVVGEPTETGTIVVGAALIQSRGDYLWMNWDKNRQKLYRMRRYWLGF